MTLALTLATFAGLCGVAVSQQARAPGDLFQASARLRRGGRVLAVLAGLVALALLGIHPHRAVACLALLWSLALSGPLLCCLRWLGAFKVLSAGGLAMLGALSWAWLA